MGRYSESALVDQEVAFYQANGIPYRTLRDGEAFVIDGHGERIVGSVDLRRAP